MKDVRPSVCLTLTLWRWNVSRNRNGDRQNNTMLPFGIYFTQNVICPGWRKYSGAWALCYASPEEIPELQRPRRATGNRRNLQCGDDSIMWANATRDMGSPCLGVVGASVWGVGLAGC